VGGLDPSTSLLIKDEASIPFHTCIATSAVFDKDANVCSNSAFRIVGTAHPKRPIITNSGCQSELCTIAALAGSEFLETVDIRRSTAAKPSISLGDIPFVI
jgi:hypothetical protein